jgi:hypothetical protein
VPESKAYKLSPEAEKLQQKNPNLFTLLQSSEKPPEELQKQLQTFMETESIQMSPETLMSQIRALAVEAPHRM